VTLRKLVGFDIPFTGSHRLLRRIWEDAILKSEFLLCVQSVCERVCVVQWRASFGACSQGDARTFRDAIELGWRIVVPLVPGSKHQTHKTPRCDGGHSLHECATPVWKTSSFATGEGLNNNAASHVSLSTAILFKITHCKKSTLSPHISWPTAALLVGGARRLSMCWRCIRRSAETCTAMWPWAIPAWI